MRRCNERATVEPRVHGSSARSRLLFPQEAACLSTTWREPTWPGLLLPKINKPCSCGSSPLKYEESLLAYGLAPPATLRYHPSSRYPIDSGATLTHSTSLQKRQLWVNQSTVIPTTHGSFLLNHISSWVSRPHQACRSIMESNLALTMWKATHDAAT